MLDGPVISCDRLAEKITSTKGKTIDTWYSGKRGGFGSDIQAVMRPDGLPVWVSAGTAGSAHDLTAARTHLLGALSWAASQLRLPTLADGGYDGAKACLVAVAQPIVDHAGLCSRCSPRRVRS